MRTPLLAAMAASMLLVACGGGGENGSDNGNNSGSVDPGDDGNGNNYSSIEGTWNLEWLGDFEVTWDGDDAIYAEANGYEGTFYSYDEVWSPSSRGIGAWCAPDDGDVCNVIVELSFISNVSFTEVHGRWDEEAEEFVVTDAEILYWDRLD